MPRYYNYLCQHFDAPSYFSNLHKILYNFIFNLILKSKLMTYILSTLMYDQAENLHKYKTSILSSVFWGYDIFITSQK